MPNVEAELPLWKGQDLRVTEDVYVPPHKDALVPVLIHKGVIPSAHVAEIEDLDSSGRSRDVQAHLAPDPNTPRMIARQLAELGLEGPELSRNFIANIAVHNYAPRPLIIDKVAIARLYRDSSDPIEGEELADLMADKSIDIDGREGRDWYKRFRDRHVKSAKNLVGVTFRIDSAKRFGIPPGEDPIKLSILEGANYRETVDGLLVPLEDSGETVLWISDSNVELGMKSGIDAVLHRGVYLSPTNRSADQKIAEHAWALLLDGGKEKWKIRFENWGKIIRGLKDSFIDAEFRRAAAAPPRSRIPHDA